MKIAWNSMKGACLLLLGLVTAGLGRGFAADIQFTSFDTLADNGAAPVAVTPAPSPFKDEAPTPPATVVPIGPSQGVFSGSASASTSPAKAVMPDLSATSSSGAGSSPCCEGMACTDDCFAGAPGRFWFQGDYMHWWTSGAHLPPVVSTYTDPTNPTGTLQTVFGNQDVGNGDHDGYRIDMGMWFDNCHCWGIEGEYFDFSGRPANYDSGLSNGYNNGNFFPLVRAVVDPTAGLEAFPVAVPTQYTGRVTVETGDYFQSAGLWLRHNLRASEWSTTHDGIPWTDSSARTFRLDAIGGYRFMRLIDSVDIRDDEMDVSNTSASQYTLYTNIDNYSAVNNFNGGELGLDALMTWGRWSLDVMAKAALGINNQDVQLFGLQRVDASVTGGGITQGSATYDFSRNVFSWIPELTLTAGYQLTDHVKFTVGYDLIYWSGVARAANQINTDPATGLPTVFNPQTFTINQTCFWAEGIRLGGEIRF